ncbi:MAG: methylmalonyl-CoA mutase family protein, partial [Candidatus Aminicenantes bacterium]|nr:methylmalonyl-CoA mutase family protein [Candidatus Aminicenantes bacterium]
MTTPKRKQWDGEFQKAALRDADFTSLSGRPLQPLYTEEDLPGFDPAAELGYPGQFPFVRGVHASMYRGKLWTMRQFSGMGTPEQTNLRYKFLLEKGQTGLSVAFDNPTLYGRDSDHPLSQGEVGKTGVAGGEVRLHHGVRIGHRFRQKRERAPFNVPREDLLHN